MKIFMIMGIIGGCLLLPAGLFAHPPSDMELSYDLEAQSLHVEMRHTTHDPREDYIRKIVVSTNADEPMVKRYNIQTNTLKFSDDIAIGAKAGDTISVKAFSKEGGSKSMSVTVKKMDDAEDAEMGKDKMTKKKRDKKSKGSGY